MVIVIVLKIFVEGENFINKLETFFFIDLIGIFPRKLGVICVVTNELG